MLQPTAVSEIAERYRKGWSGKGCRSWRGRRDSRRGLGRSRGRYRRAGLGNTGRRRGESERDCLGSGRWTQGLHGRGDCRLSRSPNVRRGAGRRSYGRGSFRCRWCWLGLRSQASADRFQASSRLGRLRRSESPRPRRRPATSKHFLRRFPLHGHSLPPLPKDVPTLVGGCPPPRLSAVLVRTPPLSLHPTQVHAGG